MGRAFENVRRWGWWWQVVPALPGGYLVWRATRSGLWFTPDGRAYLDAARSFAATGGLWLHDACGGKVWMNVFPPLFSMVAGMGIAGGFDAFAFARVLNTVCAAITVGATAWTVRDVSKSRAAGVLAGCAMALLPDFVEAHRAFLSEPPFLVMVAVGMLLLQRGIRDESRPTLLAAAVLAGLASVTRFAGLPLGPAGALMVWRGTRKKGLSAVYLVISVVPTVINSALNVYLTGATSDRHLSWNPVGMSYFTEGLATVSGWFGLNWVPVAAQAVVAGGCVLGAGVVMIRRGWRVGGAWIAGVACVSYFLFLLVIHLLLDSWIGLNPRLMIPLFGLGLVVVAGVARGRWLIGFLLVLAGINWRSVTDAPPNTSALYNANDVSWRRSETVQYAATLQGVRCYYASLPDMIDLRLNRPAGWLPRHQKGYTRTSEPGWCGQTREALAEHGSAAFVFLDPRRAEDDQVTAEEFAQCVGGASRVRLADGEVAVVR